VPKSPVYEPPTVDIEPPSLENEAKTVENGGFCFANEPLRFENEGETVEVAAISDGVKEQLRGIGRPNLTPRVVCRT
jgi:hypothetical protein